MTPVMIGILVVLALLILPGATFLYLNRVEGDIGRSAVGVAEDVEEEASKENAQDKSNDTANQGSSQEKGKNEKEKNKSKNNKKKKNGNRNLRPKASEVVPAAAAMSANQGKVTALKRQNQQQLQYQEQRDHQQ